MAMMKPREAPWGLALENRKVLNKFYFKIDPSNCFASKQMIFEVYERYVEGLNKDRLAILRYFGRDFLKGRG
jgi:integrase